MYSRAPLLLLAVLAPIVAAHAQEKSKAEEKAKKPVAVEMADFQFNTQTLGRSAVEAEEAAWKKTVEEKYAGKMVTAIGRIRQKQNSGDHDFEFMIPRVTARDPGPKTRLVEWQSPLEVRMADRKFVLTTAYTGTRPETAPRVRLVGTAFIMGGAPQLQLKLINAKFAD